MPHASLFVAALAGVAVVLAAHDDAPTIETRDGDMEFRLRRDAEATFSREKRETVTVFSLAADIGDLQRKMDVVDAAISSLPTAVNSLVTAVNAQSDSINRIDGLVTQVEEAKVATDSLKSELASVKETLSSVRSDVGSFDTVKSDLASVRSSVSGMEKDLEDLEDAVTAAAASTTKQIEDAVAAAKAATDQAVGAAKAETDDAISKVSGGETTYVNWNRYFCNGGAQTLYSGYTWGNHHDHRGGTNPVCIKEGSDAGMSQHHSSLDMMHYIGTDHCASHTTINPCNRPVACALCSIKKTCYMETGTGECSHPDYESIYSGWLFGGHSSHQAQTERICLDAQGQYPTSGQSGAYIYPVSTQNSFAGRSGGRTVVCNWCCHK